MAKPLIVYLDSQDFSRFGDVLRGKGDPQQENLFRRLEELRDHGEVVFPVSMPLISELLQYHPDYLETVHRKADVVERLCGPCALPAPMRLIALEIARSREHGASAHEEPNGMLSNDRLWFPLLGDLLTDLREKMHAGAIRSLQRNDQLSAAQRQEAMKQLNAVDWSIEIEALAPELADELGLPVKAILTSAVPLLKGEIESLEASRQMIGAVCHPRNFVDYYLGKDQNGIFPSLIKNIGSRMAEQIAELSARFGTLRTTHEKKNARSLLTKVKPNFASINVGLAKIAASEFGLTESSIDEFASTDDFLALPSSNIVISILEAYALQIMGITSSRANIEKSFGGDLMHALYLPYVDLWRGDRRFSALAGQALPIYRERIVATPSELPRAIETKLMARDT